MKNILFLLLSAFSFYKVQSQNINNPVLPGVADAGVIKYNGEYYIGGVFTKGSFYKSKDLVNWSAPFKVFSMNNNWATKFGIGDEQIHANDMVYINGRFHMYWSVNHWSRERNVIHIGHAVAENITGPFVEPAKDSWLDNRIDPKVFIDDDGKLYMYMVRFTDGNAIWVRPMKDPSTFEGEPKYIFSSLPNTWETADNRVEEGPWVMKYRNRYYLMYNTNHTSTEWGNYALGVAEAASPLDFNHGNKYPYPVVISNQWEMDEKYVDLLKYSDNGELAFTTNEPSENWIDAAFNITGWQKGKGAFGSAVIENSFTRNVKTIWKTDHIWVRKNFAVKTSEVGNIALRIHHDGATKVYLNGTLIYENTSSNYVAINLDDRTKNLLKNGENVIAFSSEKGRRSSFVEVALYNMKNDNADDILITPGQPNIVQGLNGFDWWLVYMANKNNERRGQFINRIHFFDKTLFVDGITSGKTAGSHPVPSMPTFIDLFDDKNVSVNDKWNTFKGNWKINDEELLQTGNSTAEAFIKSSAALNYYFEANVKMPDGANACAGIYAYKYNDKNWLRICINAATKSWQYECLENGKLTKKSFALAKDFNYHAYHKLSVYKNADVFTLKLDDLPAPGNNIITTNFKQEGLPGIFASNGKAAYDGIIYTVGWDEFDNTITGWVANATTQNNWKVAADGLTQTGMAGEQRVLKGDVLPSYDFSVQIKNDKTAGSAGVLAAYNDDNNFVKAAFDYANQKLVVSVKLNGAVVETKEISLQNLQPQYANMTYSDFMEKHFTFKNAVYLNELQLNKSGHLKTDALINDLHDKVEIFYRDEEKWLPLSYTNAASGHPLFEKLTFAPVKVNELKFVNKSASDHNFYIYKLWINEVFKTSYNLRVAKNKTGITLFIDGRLVYEVKHKLPASKVGLFTSNTSANFNGITLFDVQ